jgi:hypothetical protein
MKQELEEIKKIIRRGIQLHEVSERLINLTTKILRPAVLPGESIFGSDLRRVIPIYTQLQKDIKKGLEEKGYTVDLAQSTATKNGQTMRLGKVIGRELDQTILDKFSTQGGGISVIISRAPLDVLRMSDFDNIQSCHSVGGSYFQCAIREMQEGGVVAFAVNSKSLQNVNINDPEIFEDTERGIDGIKPLSRLRLRRYIDVDTAEELLIPTTLQYGHTIDGFYDALLGWAKKEQTDKIQTYQTKGKKKYNFVPLGGSYWDNEDSPEKMLQKFVGKKNVEVGLSNADGAQGYDNADDDYVKLISTLPSEFQRRKEFVIDKYESMVEQFQSKMKYELESRLYKVKLTNSNLRHRSLMFDFTSEPGAPIMIAHLFQFHYEFDHNLDKEIEKHVYSKSENDEVVSAVRSFNNKVVDDVAYFVSGNKQNTTTIYLTSKLSKKAFMNIDITKKNEVKKYFETELNNVISQFGLVISKIPELEAYFDNINNKNNMAFEANKQAKKMSKKISKKTTKKVSK